MAGRKERKDQQENSDLKYPEIPIERHKMTTTL